MRDWFRRLKYRARISRAIREVETRSVTPRPHGLDAPLVVSLTSYPARFPTLALTLKALLRQTVRADHTILWLTEGEEAELPREVLALRDEGLTIRAGAPPIRSYRKIVPTLAGFPESNIVTADDDLYYGADWLAGLVDLAADRRIVAHRAHRVTFDEHGPRPYADWKKNIRESLEGPDIFATCGSGALYPPGSLHPETVRADLFMRLCPSSDDIWLWWMSRMAGSVVRHVGPRVRVLEWPGSQDMSLRAENLGTMNGNDRAIAAMVAHYGAPPM